MTKVDKSSYKTYRPVPVNRNQNAGIESMTLKYNQYVSGQNIYVANP